MNNIGNDNMNTELENMRNQLCILKNKLDEQKIVNDRLMRKVTSERISKIKKEGYIYAFLTAIYIPINIYILWKIGMSEAFNIVTSLFLLVCLSFSIYSRRGINPDDVINGSLVALKKKMLKYKSLGNKWLMVGIPFLAFWFSWFMLELYDGGSDFNKGAMTGGCIGAAIGCVCGIIYYRKSKKNLDSAIQEISDLTKEG